MKQTTNILSMEGGAQLITATDLFSSQCAFTSATYRARGQCCGEFERGSSNFPAGHWPEVTQVPNIRPCHVPLLTVIRITLTSLLTVTQILRSFWCRNMQVHRQPWPSHRNDYNCNTALLNIAVLRISLRIRIRKVPGSNRSNHYDGDVSLFSGETPG